MVRTAGNSNVGMYAFFVVLLLGGFWLFSALSAGRETGGQVSVSGGEGNVPAITSPPPLRLPERLASAEPAAPAEQRSVLPPVVLQQVPARTTEPAWSPLPPQPASATGQMPNSAPSAGPRVVFEGYRPQEADLPTGMAASGLGAASDRVEAARLANPNLTVPQGTVISAVLETAFDSTRAGSARALVQRDVYGFDGSRVLIPRGSRLYGTYAAGMSQGERRATIQWTRLVRPDGVTIALDSPVSDPLGRAGVTGDVDGRFLARFGGALLQSVLDIGTGLATREIGSGVIVALPGSTQNVAATQSQQIQPVLRVEHGTTVSVFVARDLDFSSVES